MTAFETDTWPPVRSERDWHDILLEDHVEIEAAAAQAQVNLMVQIEYRFDLLLARLQTEEL